MGRVVSITFCVGGANRRKSEILGWSRCDGAGRSRQKDRNQGSRKKTRGLTRMKMVTEDI